ncbi:BEACH domain-containing lvsC [Gossypium australe]|uniref:BEACH domain-containing lvsC n=1 Tax=Gossypium australe TaxID=47621 RepID=A0A5B6USL6_9ROSI|nr:BEACH domain-containing lvsC [Gossypium australe]
MKILCWNVRGLGNPRVTRRLQHTLKLYKPQLAFLIETKLDHIRMEQVRKRCGFQNGMDIATSGTRGGLCLGWNETNNLQAGRTRFKFESWWLLQPTCADVIKKLWDEKSDDALDKLESLRVGLKASQRHRMNKIRGLEDRNGVLKVEGVDMEIIIKDYFMGIFKSKGVGNTDHLLIGVKRCFDEDMNQLLVAKYKDKDIVEALNSIGLTKASGPDGFPAIFF